VEGNLFIFVPVCYICPGSQKINILTAQYKRISKEQAVCLFMGLSTSEYIEAKKTVAA
jgi:hypothetical protein